MKCNKKKLDKIKAMLILSEIKNKYNRKRLEKRLYYCSECRAYHLTKQDKKR